MACWRPVRRYEEEEEGEGEEEEEEEEGEGRYKVNLIPTVTPEVYIKL